MDKPCVQFSISKLLSFALRDDPGLKKSMSFISDIQKKNRCVEVNPKLRDSSLWINVDKWWIFSHS